jgi:hypothetical protein
VSILGGIGQGATETAVAGAKDIAATGERMEATGLAALADINDTDIKALADLGGQILATLREGISVIRQYGGLTVTNTVTIEGGSLKVVTKLALPVEIAPPGPDEKPEGITT